MTRSEAGRLGGRATFERHGREHMQAIGRKGFDAFARKMGGGRLVACHILWQKGRTTFRRPPSDDPTGEKFEALFQALTEGHEIPS